MEKVIYNQTGSEAGKISLPEKIFHRSWNGDLVHQVATSIEARQRAGTAKVKGRGEVRGGGRKPWKQKGTGRARHGSIRSPIWRGGGVTHGPTPEKIYKKKINAKMAKAALFTMLSRKLKDNEIVFVDKINVSGKTKEAAKTLSSLSKIKGFENLNRKSVYLLLPKREEIITRAFRNLPKISFDNIKDINTLGLLQNKFLIIVDPKLSIEVLEKRI